MCSSSSAGKITEPYYSTCVAVADFVSSQRCCLLNVASSTEGWLLAQAPFYMPFPHYVYRTPKGDFDTFCQRNMEKKDINYLHFESGVEMLNC
jgi:hypothetical protein